MRISICCFRIGLVGSPRVADRRTRVRMSGNPDRKLASCTRLVDDPNLRARNAAWRCEPRSCPQDQATQRRDGRFRRGDPDDPRAANAYDPPGRLIGTPDDTTAPSPTSTRPSGSIHVRCSYNRRGMSFTQSRTTMSAPSPILPRRSGAIRQLRRAYWNRGEAAFPPTRARHRRLHRSHPLSRMRLAATWPARRCISPRASTTAPSPTSAEFVRLIRGLAAS